MRACAACLVLACACGVCAVLQTRSRHSRVCACAHACVRVRVRVCRACCAVHVEMCACECNGADRLSWSQCDSPGPLSPPLSHQQHVPARSTYVYCSIMFSPLIFFASIPSSSLPPSPPAYPTSSRPAPLSRRRTIGMAKAGMSGAPVTRTHFFLRGQSLSLPCSRPPPHARSFASHLSHCALVCACELVCVLLEGCEHVFVQGLLHEIPVVCIPAHALSGDVGRVHG